MLKTLGVHFIRHPCLTRKLRVLAPAAPKIIPRLLSGENCGWAGLSNCACSVGFASLRNLGQALSCILARPASCVFSHPPHQKAGLCLFVVVEVGRGCRIVLALLVSHRAKLWASTITHPCVCGRWGRCIVQRLCATAIVHPLHVYERSVGFASCLVSRLGCHIVWQLSAADFKHPCLKLWAFIL